MEKADYILKKRREVAQRYNEALKDVKVLIPPRVPEGYNHGYQSYVCLFTGGNDLYNLDLEKINSFNF